MRKQHKFQTYALLWVSKRSQQEIKHILNYECEIPESVIQRDMHLTIYHGRRLLPGLVPYCDFVQIESDVTETRFMVFVPGGENPRREIDPSMHSVGIRLTKRNVAIDEIQRLRASIYQFETEEVIGNRKPTSAWKNCFGARNYQPHIELLQPENKIHRDLKKIGETFRANIDHIVFDKFEVKCNWA